MSNPTLELGPYTLVRSHSGKHLRIYLVRPTDAPPDSPPIAVLWRVAAPGIHGIPEEWRIRCLDCPPNPRPNRPESDSKAFTDRDRALRWLLNHRFHVHPSLAVSA